MLTFSPDDRVFLLTGAGVSAESGIPTFRGVNGLWRNHRIEDVASPHAWHRDPQLVWEFYSMRRKVAAAAQPNPAHFALAQLEQRLGPRLFLCTQNVDDLHEQAGSTQVAHMHGELFKSRCDTCDRPPFQDRNLYEPPTPHPEPFDCHPERSEGSLLQPLHVGAASAIPRCPCGGQIRPHICWFGEVAFDLDRIAHQLDACTVFLAVGTSGQVEPAASFAARAAHHARTIYLGPEPPANASLFTESHCGKAGDLLPKLLA